MRTLLSIKDGYSRFTTKTFEGVATTLAQAGDDGDDLVAFFEVVSMAAVAKKTYSQDVIVVSPAPQVGANIDAGATLHCRLDNGKLYGFKIPAIDPAYLNTDGTVKIADPAITNLVGVFMTGGLFTVSEGNVIVAVEYGELDR